MLYHLISFASSSYFSQAFKKIAEVSPSSYRRLSKSSDQQTD
ncbi:AraC family transcriptional regulator [Bacillota bacterium HCP3S3_F1_1]